MTTIIVASVGAIGLVIGSFLNVVIYRLPLGMSIVRPPSHCPSCATQLREIDMVPVLSWIALRGRCRHCGAPVSVRYALVELATGIAFAGCTALGPPEAVPSMLVVCACAIVGIGITSGHHRVPDPVVRIGAVGVVSLVALAAVFGHLFGCTLIALVGGLASVGTDRLPTPEKSEIF